MKLSDFKKKLGKRIKIIRIERDLTQDELSEKIGVECNSQYISRIERGLYLPSVIRLMQIAYALNVKLDELFSNIDYLKTRIEKEG